MALPSSKAFHPKSLVKGGTTTSRKHRFESFNQRISRLNIDPIRRRGRNAIEEEDFSKSASFFRTSLDRWKDLNLSENFATFVGDVDKLCNTLPQVLHYQDRIFDTLLLYIEKRDTLALEPLLDLLSNFAHDLGARFEEYYETAVTSVASVAAKHTDPEAIEWSFTCLAWLFKYLSRLLMPDLRPTFRIMAPLLGREPQRRHTVRFAAEAMSFLLRKAALMYSKDRKPLELILQAIKEDVSNFRGTESRQDHFELYKHGLSTLFVDSMKGIKRKLHSCSGYLYRCVADLVLTGNDADTAVLKDILYGVTVALIHHTDAAAFDSILTIILEKIGDLSLDSTTHMSCTCARLLFIASAVRQGSRIQDWEPVLNATLKLLTYCGGSDSAMIVEIYKATVVTLQSSPLDIVIPRFQTAMKTIEKDDLECYFLPFCNYFGDLDRERFQDLLLPYFYKFVVHNWRGYELQLCLTFSRLGKVQGQKAMTCPEKWQDAIVGCFNHALVRDDLILQCFGYIDLIDHVSNSSTTYASIQQYLNKMAYMAIQSPNTGDMLTSFGLGAGLASYARSAPPADEQLLELWPELCAQAPRYGNVLPFLETMLEIVNRKFNGSMGDEVQELVEVVIDNLHSPSTPLRKMSLEILQALYQKQHSRPANALTTALEIERSPLDLSSTRSMSMHIRNLSSSYQACSTHGWLPKAIAHFCFGLLSYKLASANSDAVAALTQICKTKIGEEIVSELCFTWLEQSEQGPIHGSIEKIHQSHGRQLTDFQCSNLIQVERLINDNSKQVDEATEVLRHRFDHVHKRHDQQVAGAPSLALRVLLSIPHIAEKRSRRLVPIFLSWAISEEADIADVDTEDEDSSPALSNQNLALQIWGLKDRKAMLNLFGSFHNPTVLYRSSEVLEALQGLLTNGDLEIQKAALKAISTWKIKELQPYQEHLSNLLDENRFREEISTFLQIDDQESIIEIHHRQVLMPFLLKLLYGRMVARSGSKSGKAGQTVKRKAVIQALSRLDEDYLRMFVDITLGSLKNVNLLEIINGEPRARGGSFVGLELNEQGLAEDLLSTRKQAGLINMLKDMLSVLGSRLVSCTSALTNALLYCLICASRQLRSANDVIKGGESEAQQISLLRTTRRSGLQCLVLLFKSLPFEQFEPYMGTIYKEILKPRLDNLPIETAQSVSGTLQLLSTLASSDDTIAAFRDYDDGQLMISAVVKCLEVPSAKDEVKLYVLDDILKRIVNLTSSSSPASHNMGNGINAHQVLRSAMDLILEHLEAFLRKSPGKELLASAIELVSMLAPLVEGSSQSHSLLEISTFLLDQPSQRVSPKSKGDLLEIIKNFLPMVGSELPETLLDHIFQSTSSLFGYFKDRPNRLVLSEVMTVLAGKDHDLQRVAELCAALNSFSAKRLDEPDFEQRMKAFGVINEQIFQDFSPRQWQPLVYNMLYFIKDNEELAIRTNASFALRRFVETNVMDSEDINPESSRLVKSVLLPALRSGVLESSELVRIEYLGIMALLVQSNPSWDEINDMRPLLMEVDEEASFFGNVLHIQQHRRLRALRRLAAEARQGGLRNANVAHFFIPLIEHFVFDKTDDESAHNLSAEAVKTLGALASSLEWPQFRATFRRYSGYIRSKPELEKTVIRLLVVIIDSLVEASHKKQKELDYVNDTVVEMPDSTAFRPVQLALTKTMPGEEKLADELLNNLLPSLTKYLYEKDESTVSLRVPVAVSVVKLLKLLPPDEFRERLPPVLTDVCHMLRSRAQESRDLTRKTLTEISTMIGPAYFGFVLKELRSALARGYQRHVLSFTVHSILVATSDIFKPGDLDYCLNQIVAVIMDDIFGATGQEKDAEEYISKMKEVKSRKSFDSMELVAKTATVENLVYLIRPLHDLLEEKLDLRLVKKIDELLRRIGVGLLQNGCIQDQRVLVFCHEVIHEVYKAVGTSMEKTKNGNYRIKRYLIQAGGKKAGNRGGTSSYNYKLARFALDILRMVLHKYDALQTSSNLAGFIPIIGDAIVQSNEEIQISALRLLTTIIKVPLKSIDDNAAIYVTECVTMVKSSMSTNVELAQAALKLVSAILRERRTIEVRETDLAYLLRRLIPDLEEPDKQGVAFNFLKAVMIRKIVITEVYEVMDVVAVIMVTNQTKSARDMARGAYFYFIMDYPHSKERFSKQLSFLVRNLDYQHQEGRQSVMEAVHLLFTKVGEDLTQVVVSTFFVPLVMVIANDRSSQCREMAGALLKTSFGHADAQQMQSFLNMLRGWVDQPDQPLLMRVALQAYGMYLEVKGTEAEKEITSLQTRLAKILQINLKDPDTADWEILYFTLQAFAKLCNLFPASAFSSNASPIWASIRQCLAFPHAWVKLSSAKLLGSYFADFARKNTQNDNTELPLKGSGGLRLSEQEIVNITCASLALLKVPAVSEDLAAQSVRNLVFLGKIMAQTSMLWPTYQKSRALLAAESAESTDESNKEEDEWEEGDDDIPSTTPTQKQALTHLLTNAAQILRQPPATTRAPSLTPHHSTLPLLATLLNTLPLPALTPSLPTILHPLHNLTDPSIPTPFSIDPAFTESYKSLQTKAVETMDVIAKRVGVTVYASLMQGVRDEVRGRREERRGKRRIGAVAEPVKAGEKRRKKWERKREGRRKRGEEFGRGRRGL